MLKATLRAATIWLLIIVVETNHGTLSTLLLKPSLDDLLSRQRVYLLATALSLNLKPIGGSFNAT